MCIITMLFISINGKNKLSNILAAEVSIICQFQPGYMKLAGGSIKSRKINGWNILGIGVIPSLFKISIVNASE